MGFIGDKLSPVTAFFFFSTCVGLVAVQSPTLDQDAQRLFPVVFNLATMSLINATATCGEREPEVFCKLVEHVRIFPAENRHCDVCDARSENPAQRHPITNAIDGSNRWWQSPTLTNGERFNYVNVTLDLRSIYQVAYVIIKAANSPRPGNWVLERSLDGILYKPWQYFVMADHECQTLYGLPTTVGVPVTLGDDEVICTTRYSRLDPLEDGEIFVSLVNGRPGVFRPSKVLLDFTSARYVQLRLLKIRTLNADLMAFERLGASNVDPSVTRRYFYSIKDISIGGQCICYGHATHCKRHDRYIDRFQCQCQDNTGGDNCEECLPLYNQRPWRAGGISGLGCEECNCHGKASECVYNATINTLKLSLNKDGNYEGGGVCQNCQGFTAGINCEKCIEGYYRPRGVSPYASRPCRPCNCHETVTSTGKCIADESKVIDGLNPGDCICKPGFGGPSCTSCAYGYYGYPNCQVCPCNPSGSIDSRSCEQPCLCKLNVMGNRCDQCKPGFYNLDHNNPHGCMECFCFGVTSQCRSSEWQFTKINDLSGWIVSTLEPGGLTLLPQFFDGWLQTKTYLLNINNVNFNILTQESSYRPATIAHYWFAPRIYLGNQLSSYGGQLRYSVKYTLDNRLTSQFYLSDPDVILKGSNMTIAYGRQHTREFQESMMCVVFTEEGWVHAADQRPVTRRDFMTVLLNLEQLMIKATYHTAQDTVYLKGVCLDSSHFTHDVARYTLPTVEQCQCPEGYAGLSCESCAPGWRRERSQLYGGVCRRCQCYNHASQCNPDTGVCLDCKHNTAGNNCERCLPGFYGDARLSTEQDCQPCACPLISGNNFFAETCRSKPTIADRHAYECINCREGYQGAHCEICASGYYGRPTEAGGMCRKCNCGGNIDLSTPGSCNDVTGACIRCTNNAEGTFCERCKPGYYGSAVNGDCSSCGCSPEGSISGECNQRTGQCFCKPRFVGLKCDRCQTGYGDVTIGCVPCSCNMTGSTTNACDPVSGICVCHLGISGKRCDQCAEGHFGFSQRGCQRCNCYSPGTSNNIQCDNQTGRCKCQPNVIGQRCEQCQRGYFGIDSGKGCSECACDRIGSTSSQCNQLSGQCQCRLGVGGRACNRCQPGYYGFSSEGCRVCQLCSKPGHICDPITGACVCPPGTTGPQCQRCESGYYGFNNISGCKRCNCTKEGSASQQCDPESGLCTCLYRFRGFSCDTCASGYFDFPSCGACACISSGTLPDSCSHPERICDCDTIGQCQCKVNVIGKQCDRCRNGTFSLQTDNPKGCTECYCFHRSMECVQAPYSWTMILVPVRRVTLSSQALQPGVEMSGYLVINNTQVNVALGQQSRPLYWSMPKELLGDKTHSYNGRLDFVHYFEGPEGVLSSSVIAPLVILKGNGFELHAVITSLESKHANSFSITLNENNWYLPGQKVPVSRRLLMVVLQNVTNIFIRATQDGQATYAEIGPVSLEIAVPSQNLGNRSVIAYGVEMCQCPDRYSGLSCQNPGKGYYRVPPKDTGPNFEVPETALGHVRPCQCYLHSNVCNAETGVCINCSHNTVGDKCDQCAPGYYGIATRGTPKDCEPCACPLVIPTNNFSPTCTGVGRNMVCTNCRVGYTGQWCERCLSGYYGNPSQEGSQCQPCSCDLQGSVDNKCDPLTGQCHCLPGIQGHRCDRCQDIHQGVQNGACMSCYDGCTGVLLNDLKNMSFSLQLNITGVAYPWEDVYRLHNETVELKTRMEALKGTSQDSLDEMNRMVDFYKNLTNNQYNRAESLCEMEVNFTGSKAVNVKHKADETRKNASDIRKIVDDLFQEIRGNISQLNQLLEKLYHQQSGLNVTAALKEAQNILRMILRRNFTQMDKAAKKENLDAEKLSERVRTLGQHLINTTQTANRIADLLRRLEDLFDQAEDAKVRAEEMLNEESQKIAAAILELEDKLKKLQEVNEDTQQLLKEGQFYIREAQSALDQMQQNILFLERQLYSLRAAIAELERRFGVIRAAMPSLESLYQDTWKHVHYLENISRTIANLFTKDDVQDPMRAARAYESIVQAIRQAEISAREALRQAQQSVNIASVGDLKDEVRRSLERSRRLLTQAENLLKKAISDLANKLNAVKKDVGSATDMHRQAVNLLTMLLEDLDKIPKGFGERLNIILQRVTLVFTKSYNVNITVHNILSDIETVLRRNITWLENFDITDIIYRVGSDVDEARKQAQFVLSNVQDVRKKGQEVLRNATSVSQKIIDLRDKIDKARNMTNSMKMSLSGEGDCVRSYRSQLSPGVTNEVSMGVKLNRTNVDMLLLLLQESAQEYLALEIQKNMVKFSWDVGGGQGSVTHDLELQAFQIKEDEKKKWYRILAKRIGNFGELKVWPVEGNEADAVAVKGKSQAGHSLINFNHDTSVFMGGFSASHKPPQGVTQNKLYGCIGDINIDGKSFGVYNFHSSHGNCRGCVNVPQQVPSTNVYNFDGYGYATLLLTSTNFRTDFFNIGLKFKTFWGNSRLIFAGNKEVYGGDFLSIDLVGGKIVVQYYLGSLSVAQTETNLTYNTNRWVTLSVARDRTQALLQLFLEDQSEPIEKIYFKPNGTHTGLDLMGQNMYIGGLPESYPLDRFPFKEVKDSRNFLGCMSDIGVGGRNPISQDLSAGELVSITFGCKDKGIRQVGFYGNGYLIFDGVSLSQTSNISLSFFTKQSNALLLLATDVQLDSFYSIALTNGQLEARLSTNGSPMTTLQSNISYSDGAVHYVALIKHNRRIQMYVDDLLVDEDSIGSSGEIILGPKSNLWFGGSKVAINGMAASDVFFDGCISDIIINDELLALDQVKQYELADIGRCRESVATGRRETTTHCELITSEPPLTTRQPATPSPVPVVTTIAETQATACSSFKAMDVAIEPNAKTLGNSYTSFSQITENIKISELRRGFNISFEFRTYFEDGLLGLLTNENQTVYFAAQLKGGKLEIVYTFRDQQKRITSSGGLADGQWHLGQIIKDKTNLTVQLDKQFVNKDKIESRLMIDLPLYLGSLPKIEDLKINLVNHSLRGCVRNLHFNSVPIDITDTDIISSVEHCYSSVEQGAAFTGNSWGIYNLTFDVAEQLAVELEFRTSEQNGIFLTISNSNGQIGMTLELHNGKVKFGIKNEGDLFRAESKYNSEFSLCGNQWHTVRAEYLRNVVKLNVDNQGDTFGVSKAGHTLLPTNAPLFIGGVQNQFSRQAASLSNTGFKGCIRNLKIRGSPVDWYNSLVDAIDIQRTACPV